MVPSTTTEMIMTDCQMVIVMMSHPPSDGSSAFAAR
jgi:hypothetical protein